MFCALFYNFHTGEHLYFAIKKAMKMIISFAMLMTITLICNGQTKSNALMEEALKEIKSSNAVFSDLANKNDGSILTRYAEDACLFPPNHPPVCGKENIAHFFKDGPKVHSKFIIQHLYGDAKEFVTEESYYEMTDMKGDKLDEGKVVVIWKKTSNGWKMYRDMFSSNRPLSK